MSITASLPQLPRQKESGGELHVFEAVAYFSAAAANQSYAIPPNKMMRSSHGRMSLDIPMMTSSFPSQRHNTIKYDDDDDKKKKNNKQPNSPGGGKLASFFASLFNQTYSKKKKSKNIKDGDEVGIRRKRRSSISHFQSHVNTTFSNSFYSSNSNSQLKTPLPNSPNTLTNTSTLSHNNFHVQSPSLYRKVYNIDDEKKINNSESSWLDEEKFEFGINSHEFSLEKYNTFANGVLGDHTIDDNQRNLIKDEDEGAESDSSSDLFELQNYDLVSCYSSDLPVYETTNINSIYQERCTNC